MKFVAIDGNSLINRAFYGVSTLQNSKGFPTHAIYGFYNVLNKILIETKPTHVMVAFDVKAKTFRHKQFDGYKANRKLMPNELFLQLVEVKNMLNLMGLCVCEKTGFEADDLLGTISQICTSQKIECVIASGDRDVLQLINKYVTVRLSLTKQVIWFDENKVCEMFNVKPKQLIEVKALMGDSSDNIPGVKGIGEKTALKLISTYGSIENIFQNIDNLKVSNRVKNLLKTQEAKDISFLSRSLATIYLNVDLNSNLSFYSKKEVDWNGLKCFLEKFELKKILNNFNGCGNVLNFNYKNVEDEPIGEQIQEILNCNQLSLINEKIKQNQMLNFFFYNGFLYILTNTEIFKFGKLQKEAFEYLISKSEQPKRTTDLKQVFKFCLENGLSLNNVEFSCDIAAYLIDVLDQNYTILNLTNRFFNSNDVVNNFIKLSTKLEKMIESKNLNFVLNEIELPLAKILAEMEFIGFEINVEKLNSLKIKLNFKKEELTNEIWEFCGKKFNINSTKEMSSVLFDDLKLPKGKKTKTGYSTDFESLEKLVKHSEVITKILNYRLISKLESTYVQGLEKAINIDNRIHSTFNQIQTKTGRISSNKPNIQNIPVKTELGSEFRTLFIAGRDKIIIDGDYSQIELRILADLANDVNLINAFKSNIDIHNLTASKIFGVEIENVSVELRRRAKIINFSIIYGSSAFSLAKEIGVSVSQANSYIENFFNNFNNIKIYFDSVIKQAEKDGEVRTMFGRIRKIPEIKSNIKKTKLLGERIAKNTPIQGSCADLIKLAMIKIKNRFILENIEANIILQVHDEILIETFKQNETIVSQILKFEMENVAKLKVKLDANVSTGLNWLEAKK